MCHQHIGAWINEIWTDSKQCLRYTHSSTSPPRPNHCFNLPSRIGRCIVSNDAATLGVILKHKFIPGNSYIFCIAHIAKIVIVGLGTDSCIEFHKFLEILPFTKRCLSAHLQSTLLVFGNTTFELKFSGSQYCMDNLYNLYCNQINLLLNTFLQIFHRRLYVTLLLQSIANEICLNHIFW